MLFFDNIATHARGCAGSHYPFLTQKERDTETGLDFFLSRYYSSGQGRFTTPDSFGGFRVDPQSLNLYSYVQNNPTRYVDPTGHAPIDSELDPYNCPLCKKQDPKPKPKPATPIGSDGEIGGEGDLIVSNIEAPKWKKNENKKGQPVSQPALSANDGMTDASFLFNAGGFAASGGEFYFVVGSTWRGLNGKTYNMNWGGNQYTGGRSLAFAKAGVFKAANKAFFFAGASISAYQGYQNIKQGNYAGGVKNGLDICMSACATFGGPYGLAVGGTYFVADTIGWKNISDSHEKLVRDVERVSGMPYRKYMGPIY